MKAKVTIGIQESDLFNVLARVKQGCVLAPVIFNMFLVAVTLVCRNGLPSNAGIPYTYPVSYTHLTLPTILRV